MSQAQVVRVKINEQIETEIADPEVRSKATRRRFGQAYKRKVLSEAEACKKPGEVGALLCREGLYDWNGLLICSTTFPVIEANAGTT